jgi:NAD(P)-dependent dehydrogenase (short-subunit alcohol dehydrogenase family)
MPDPTRSIVPDGMLQDKVIVIAGASQGIGTAAAFGFARAGAKVVLGARRKDLVEQHAERIRSAGGSAVGVETDVTDEDSQRRLVERAVAEYGRLDGAFNNAGVDQHPALPHELALEEWRHVLGVKADGTFLGLKHQCPAILATAGKGAIVNHGSVVGDRGIATLAAPCASQAAIVGLTKAATKAYGPELRINMLATGPIRTPEREGMYPETLPDLPARRPGTAEECAAVAAWLLSDYSSYQYGAVVAVDGGQWA